MSKIFARNCAARHGIHLVLHIPQFTRPVFADSGAALALNIAFGVSLGSRACDALVRSGLRTLVPTTRASGASSMRSPPSFSARRRVVRLGPHRTRSSRASQSYRSCSRPQPSLPSGITSRSRILRSRRSSASGSCSSATTSASMRSAPAHVYTRNCSRARASHAFRNTLRISRAARASRAAWIRPAY